MRIWSGCSEVPPGLPPTSVTIGTFDGVHLGHGLLLDSVVADSQDGSIPVVVTFDPHPMAFLRPGSAPLLLTSLERRLELLAAAGIQATLVMEFNRELAAQSAEQFAVQVLARTLHAQHVVVGRNFRFGHRAGGDVTLLGGLGRELGFEVTVVDLASTGPVLGLDPGDASAPAPVVSSTVIRGLIADGEVAAAAQALGRPHELRGQVVHGAHRGRELGFPTANLDIAAVMSVPADGVYAGWLRAAGGDWLEAAISIGTNPTFGDSGRRVEVYVLDAPPGYDIYGATADVSFTERIRPTVRFDSVGELVEQMAADVRAIRAQLVGSHPATPTGVRA
jgi:riboflavin kinase / FMN adenylyltransferase